DRARTVDRHLVDLPLADTALAQRRQHLADNRAVVPLRHGAEQLLRRVVEDAAGVVREHHPIGVTALAKLRHGIDALFEARQAEAVQAEAVHADVATALDELFEVVEIRGVAAVADHDAAEIDALFGEDILLLEADLARRVRVRGDRYAGAAVGAGDRAQGAFVRLGHARLIGGRLEDAGANIGALNPLLD